MRHAPRKYHPALDSLESREVPSTVGLGPFARAQQAMAIQLQVQRQAVLRAQQQMAANPGPVGLGTRAAVALPGGGFMANTGLRGNIAANIRSVSAGFSNQLRVVAPFRPINAIRNTVLNSARTTPVLAAASTGLNTTTAVNGTTTTATLPTTTTTVPTQTTTGTNLNGLLGNTLLGTVFRNGLPVTSNVNLPNPVIGSSSVAFRNGLPVTTSLNTANTFAFTSPTVMFPNGFPVTTGLNLSNTIAGTSPNVIFPNGFPVTTGLPAGSNTFPFAGSTVVFPNGFPLTTGLPLGAAI